MILKLILFSLLLHCLDDFVFQAAFLNRGKQKNWWREQIGYSDLYKNDYLVCLIVHGLEWSLITFLPILILEESTWFLWGMIAANTVIHAYVDDLKANKERINLVTDQVIHISQILLTYFVWGL